MKPCWAFYFLRSVLPRRSRNCLSEIASRTETRRTVSHMERKLAKISCACRRSDWNVALDMLWCRNWRSTGRPCHTESGSWALRKVAMERKHVTFRPDFVREKRRCIPDVRLIFVVQEQIDVRRPVWPVYDDVALPGKELPVTWKENIHDAVIPAPFRKENVIRTTGSQNSFHGVCIGGSDEYVDVVIPKNHAVVAEGSDQRSADDEVSQVLRLESSHGKSSKCPWAWSCRRRWAVMWSSPPAARPCPLGEAGRRPCTLYTTKSKRTYPVLCIHFRVLSLNVGNRRGIMFTILSARTLSLAEEFIDQWTDDVRWRDLCCCKASEFQEQFTPARDWQHVAQ